MFACEPIFVKGNQKRFFSLVGVVGDERGDFDRFFPFTLNVLVSKWLFVWCGNMFPDSGDVLSVSSTNILKIKWKKNNEKRLLLLKTEPLHFEIVFMALI